jgi:hypothetical protein
MDPSEDMQMIASTISNTQLDLVNNLLLKD